MRGVLPIDLRRHGAMPVAPLFSCWHQCGRLCRRVPCFRRPRSGQHMAHRRSRQSDSRYDAR